MSDIELKRRTAWIAKVRGLHRWKRFAGVMGALIGAILMVWAKSRPDVPEVLINVGMAIALASVALLFYSMYARWMWVKQNPYKPDEPA